MYGLELWEYMGKLHTRVIVILRETESMLAEALPTEPSSEDLGSRAVQTLSLMHAWGFAPTIDALAEQLLGGRASREDLDLALSHRENIVAQDGFVALKEEEKLLTKSHVRVASNTRLNGHARRVAEEYAGDLVRYCPFIQCVAISGSVASGAYAFGDDIDFDLFVQSGTKYATYLIANLLGLKYSWRYRTAKSDPVHRLPFLPKVVCVNVVWPEDQTNPFQRQDAGLAFELMRCIPLWGALRFRSVIDANPWIEAHFPQIAEGQWHDSTVVSESRLSGLLRRVVRHVSLRRLLEFVSRGTSWVLYQGVQLSRRKHPAARARMEFLRRVKYPYEVFQD